jgi:hypothetical protein
MCTFVFAPGRSLAIEYAAETIGLLPTGASVDLLDLLVTNRSDQSVSELAVLYPHRMSAGRGSTSRGQVSRFEDVTNTLFDEGSVYNRFHQYPGNRILRAEVAETAARERGCPGLIPATGTMIAIEQADPMAPEGRPLLYCGNVRGTHTVRDGSRHGISAAHRCILDELHASVFWCELECPMEKNESRWFRWRIRPPMSCLNPMTNLTRILRLMTRKLDFQYAVLGPGTVRRRFTEQIILFLQEAAGNRVGGLVQEATGLKEVLVDKGYLSAGTQVVVNDWRVNVFPGRAGRLTRTEAKGQVVASGTIPKMMPIDSDVPEELCYQWKAGGRNVEHGEAAEFIIDLESRVDSLLVPWIPWIALVLSVWEIWGSDIRIGLRGIRELLVSLIERLMRQY